MPSYTFYKQKKNNRRIMYNLNNMIVWTDLSSKKMNVSLCVRSVYE